MASCDFWSVGAFRLLARAAQRNALRRSGGAVDDGYGRRQRARSRRREVAMNRAARPDSQARSAAIGEEERGSVRAGQTDASDSQD